MLFNHEYWILMKYLAPALYLVAAFIISVAANIVSKNKIKENSPASNVIGYASIITMGLFIAINVSLLMTPYLSPSSVIVSFVKNNPIAIFWMCIIITVATYFISALNSFVLIYTKQNIVSWVYTIFAYIFYPLVVGEFYFFIIQATL